MRPCFDAVREHIGSLIGGLMSDGQANWDIRFDFLSYCASQSPDGTIAYGMRSLRTEGLKLFGELYQPQPSSGLCFTNNLEEFRLGLVALKAAGDEASLVALDTALDFPWRDASLAHRVVILLTDEALETGLAITTQTELIPDIIEKIHQLRIMLHLVGPASEAFDQLSAADKSEYTVIQDVQHGLSNVDFAQTFSVIGKSISASTLQAVPSRKAEKKALFGQESWTEVDAPMRGS
jgi:hypothetical protein